MKLNTFLLIVCALLLYETRSGMEKVDFTEPLFFLHVIGMHPLKCNKFARIRQVFSVGVFIIAMISGTLEIIFHSKGLETYARASDSMVPQYQLVFKMLALILNRKKIAKLLQNSARFWPLEKFGPDYHKKFNTVHVFLRKFFLFYKYSIVFTCSQFLAVTIIFKTKKPMCISYGENENHGSLYTQLYFVLHGFIVIVSINIINGFDGLFFYLIGHMLSELHMVKIAFGTYKIEQSWNDRKRFRISAKHHSHVLEFIGNLNNIFSTAFLIQYLSSLFGICFGLFLMSKDGLPPHFDVATKYMPYILSFILQTWTFCFAGHLLTVWSLEIPNEIFYHGWDKDIDFTNLNGRMIAIQRGQKAAKLTIGDFRNLDLESFKIVMQKAFSFLAFINTVMEKKELSPE